MKAVGCKLTVPTVERSSLSMRHLKARFLLEQRVRVFSGPQIAATHGHLSILDCALNPKVSFGLLQPSRKRAICFMLARGTVCMHQAMMAPHGTTFRVSKSMRPSVVSWSRPSVVSWLLGTAYTSAPLQGSGIQMMAIHGYRGMMG